MNKMLFVLTIAISGIASAQSLKASFEYKNGKTVEVLADELAKVNKKNQLAYKSSNVSAKDYVSLDELSKITYQVDGKTAIAEPVEIAELKNEKKWLYKLYSGKLNAYTFTDVDLQSTFRNGNFFTQQTNLSTYVFQYKNEPGHIVSVVMSGPMMINTFQKKNNLKLIGNFFKDKCSQVITAYDKGDIKYTTNPMVFAEYFEKNCN